MSSSGYAAWSVVFGEQPTATKWNILGSNDSSFNLGTGLEDGVIIARHLAAGSVGSPALATGVPVQMVATNYSAVATGSTLIPHDDTIPQNTEGDQYMSQSITPKSATNLLVIQVDAMIAYSANGYKAMALFQDSASNALAAKFSYQGNWTDPLPLIMTHVMVAGTTSATVFKMRAGSEVAGTMTFNGALGGRFFGTTTKSCITITEIKV